MARVVAFLEDSSLDASRSRSTVECRWSGGQMAGERVILLRTYGSESRQNRGTPSQALELDAAQARSLIEAIRSVFPALLD